MGGQTVHQGEVFFVARRKIHIGQADTAHNIFIFSLALPPLDTPSSSGYTGYKSSTLSRRQIGRPIYLLWKGARYD